jgi:hypothetical protein
MNYLMNIGCHYRNKTTFHVGAHVIILLAALGCSLRWAVIKILKTVKRERERGETKE